MRQVTPFTANILRRTSGEDHVTSFLEDFHEKHWGRRNGETVAYRHGGATGTILAINDSFDIDNKGFILVRECYLGLWDYLRSIYLDVKDDDDLKTGYRGTVLYGHPGIGKSVGLYFLMCAAAEARIPFVFHRAPSSDAYVCLDEQAWHIPATMIPKIQFTTRALVLIDSCADVGLTVDVYGARSAHVVVASPPVYIRYKEFVKYTWARFYTLELPKMSELGAILHLRTLRAAQVGNTVSVLDRSHISLVDIEDVDDDDSFHADNEANRVCNPLELFELLGPNLRVVLSGSGQPEALILEMEQQALMRLGIRAATALSRGELIDTAAYDRLFFQQPHSESPITPCPPDNSTIPTRFLRGILRDAIRTLKLEDQLAALAHSSRFDP